MSLDALASLCLERHPMVTAILLALLSTSPLPATCVCSCVFGVYPDGSGNPPPTQDRAVLFQGTALEVNHEAGYVRSVRFVVQRVWRGEVTDTVTLEVGRRGPCAYYRAGEQYLVASDDRESPSGPLLAAGPCHESVPSGSPQFDRLLLLLGPSRTVHGDPLLGSLRESTTLVGSAPRPAADTVTLGLSLRGTGTDDAAEVLVADQRLRLRNGLVTIRVPAGAYEVRIFFSDGSQASALISVRCENFDGSPDSTPPCRAYRSLNTRRSGPPAG